MFHVALASVVCSKSCSRRRPHSWQSSDVRFHRAVQDKALAIDKSAEIFYTGIKEVEG